MTQSWHDLLFAHWRVDVSSLRRAVPSVFELDLFDGQAWLSVVPFYMTNVGIRLSPSLPGMSRFLELNVRTYVRVADRPGVYFFSLDAARWPPVAAARTFLNLPYYTAHMTLERHREGFRYTSSRRKGPPARFEAIYEPVRAPYRPSPGSIDYFLTERYCLYHHSRRGHPYRLDIHHRPWPLYEARATIVINTLSAGRDVAVSGAPALSHFARRQDVIVWAPTRLR